jgi:hypothetical protein
LKPVSQASPEQSNFALFLSANKQGDIVILSKTQSCTISIFVGIWQKRASSFYLLLSASICFCFDMFECRTNSGNAIASRHLLNPIANSKCFALFSSSSSDCLVQKTGSSVSGGFFAGLPWQPPKI